MGSTFSADVTWSLGCVAGSRVSDGQVLELCGASNRIEAAYQKWLAGKGKDKNKNTGDGGGRDAATATATATAVAATEAKLTLEFAVVSTDATDAATVPSSPPPNWLRAKLLIDFEAMTGQLVLPMPFTISEAQLHQNKHNNVSVSSVDGQGTPTQHGQSVPDAGKAAESSLVVTGAQPARTLLRNGVPPAVPADDTIPQRAYRGRPWWMWMGRGQFRDYTSQQRARLEALYQTYLDAKTAYHLTQVNPTATPTQFTTHLAAYNAAREVTVIMNRGKYRVNFETMEQQNTKTGKVRPMRRIAQSTTCVAGRAADQQPVSVRENDLTLLAALGDGDMVPLWKWEQSKRKGTFEPYTPALCAQIERLYQEALRDVAEAKKANGNDAAATVDPHLMRKSVRMFTRPTARRSARFIFSFENPNRFQQINARTLVARTVIRTLVPRTAILQLVQLDAQSALTPPPAVAPTTTTGVAITSGAATLHTQPPSSESTQPQTGVTEAAGDKADGMKELAGALGLSEASVESRNRIASAWGCIPTLPDTLATKGTAPTTAPTATAAATAAAPSIDDAQKKSTDAARWQYVNRSGRIWYDMLGLDNYTIETYYQEYLKKKEEAAKAAGGNSVASTAAAAVADAADAGTTPSALPYWQCKGVRCGRQHYTIDFEKLTQLNEQTGKIRAIRRQVTPLPDPHSQATPADANAVPAAAAAAATVTPPAAAVGATTPTDAGKQISTDKDLALAMEEEKAPRGDASTYLGRGQVDRWASKDLVARCVVYADAKDGLYMCMLNKADITANNNKFYFMQVLHAKDKPDEFYLFTRWGRVGNVGQTNEERFNSADAATTAFKRAFHSKTRNSWEDRKNAKLKRGRYMLMRIDNRTEEEREAEDGPVDEEVKKHATAASERLALKKPDIVVLPSRLHPLVFDLMKYITDRNDMNNMMSADFSLDVKRMPLGRITKAQIKDAFTVLTQLEKVIKSDQPSSNKELVELSNMFYTLLPHVVSTHSRLPAIDNLLLLQKKIDLVQTLGDIEIANEIMKMDALSHQQREQQLKDGKPIEVINQMDKVYNSLKCDLAPIDMNDPIAQRIKRYAELTRGETHYNVPHVEQIFSVRRTGEDERWQTLQEETKGLDYGPKTNVRMLWHGSRKTNYLGILSQGLRIAPPEAPSTGYMFGKGIYFADVVSKASGYCHPVNNKGLMLLSEVGLGKMLELGNSKFMTAPEKGYFSTKGVGSMAPSAKEVHDGVTWAIGPVKKQQHPRVKRTSLYYPEYIIYNPAQYRMRYLIQVAFRSK